jgi:hypothetical protein
MRSPCFECKSGAQDKDNRTCKECDARVAYVWAAENKDLYDFIEAGSVFIRNQAMFKPAKKAITDKKEAKMSVRGECGNCERKNMTLPARGLCGLCNRAWVNAPEDGKEAALSRARAKVNGSDRSMLGHPLVGPREKGPASGIQESGKTDPVAVTYKLPEKPVQGVDMIILEFRSERDKALLLWFEEYSRSQRRSAGDQIKTVLDRYMDIIKSELPAP